MTMQHLPPPRRLCFACDCLFVCQQDNSTMSMNFDDNFGAVEWVISNERLHLCGDADRDADTSDRIVCLASHWPWCSTQTQCYIHLLVQRPKTGRHCTPCLRHIHRPRPLTSTNILRSRRRRWPLCCLLETTPTDTD